MRINNDDAELSGKVSPALARKIQPLILKAMASEGLERGVIQSALLWELEGIPARIGVATAERLLKDPRALVQRYHMMKEQADQQKQANFDRNLRQMADRIAPVHPEDTFRELKGKFPTCRNFQQMQTAGKLHVENGGRPLTIVPLPWEFAVGKDHPASHRMVGQNLVLKDGESVLLAYHSGLAGSGVLLGPLPSEKLDIERAGFYFPVSAELRPVEKVVASPPVPQMSLPFVM